MLSSRPLFHQSKFQNTVILSSTEAKYMAICEARNEALWVSQFLAAFGFQLPTLPVDLCIDNKVAISLTGNPEFYSKTKHIELQYHWICEKIESNKIPVSYILTKNMVANGLTKPLNLQLFKKFRVMMEIN